MSSRASEQNRHDEYGDSGESTCPPHLNGPLSRGHETAAGATGEGATHGSAAGRAERVAEQVSQLIESVTPGSRLGAKEELRRLCEVSVGTCNEALRLLQARGLVTVRPGPGGGLFSELSFDGPAWQCRHRTGCGTERCRRRRAHPGRSRPTPNRGRPRTSWCVIAGEAYLSCSRPFLGQGCAVGDEAGDGSVCVGQAITTMGPAHQLLPALVIGQGVLNGDAVG